MQLQPNQVPKGVPLRAVSEITPYARNARNHDRAQVAAVSAVILKLGFLNPVIVDENGELLAGHCRLLAANELGIEAIPCIEVLHLTPPQKQLYRIADNKLPERATWDGDLLRLELLELEEVAGLDLALSGLTDAELEELLDDQDATEDGPGRDEGKYAEPEKPLGNPVIAYNLVFESEEQQRTWYRYTRYLKLTHPDLATVAARVVADIESREAVANA